jgi:CHASE3 domain sensor protein
MARTSFSFYWLYRENLLTVAALPADKESDMNLSLKQKLLAGFAVNCLLTVATSLCILFQVQRMHTVQTEINTVRIPSALAAVRLGRYISDASFAFRNYLLYHDDAVLAAKYETARHAGWKNGFAQYDVLKQLGPVEDQELLAKLDGDLRNGSLKIQEDALVDISTGGQNGMHNALERMKGGSALVAKIQADTVEVTRRVEERLATDNATLAAAQTTTWIMALVAGLLTSVSGIFIGIVLSRQILSGIQKISGRIGEVAQGDLSGEPLTHSVHDEIGETVDNINVMHANDSAESASRAGASINGIIQASDSVKDMISQIATASQQQSAATDEVNRTLNEIAQTIDRSTAGTQDSAKACAELSRLGADLQESVSQFRL